MAIPLIIHIPREKPLVLDEDSIMRKGVAITPGASVVISVPMLRDQRRLDTFRQSTTGALAFQTNDRFNLLEQHIERGLLAIGLRVKDRSKFEAKLRDIRRSTSGVHNQEEVSDISELIRAAQDGDVQADYVLQVNDFSVVSYLGSPLELAMRPEVKTVIRENPNLQIGEEEGKMIPKTIAQPLVQVHFNAKLIDAKSGSIDWIGEYSFNSLAALEEGISIHIPVYRHTVNANIVVDEATAYNDRVNKAYQRAVYAKDNVHIVNNTQSYSVDKAKQDYQKALEDYNKVVKQTPSEADNQWIYDYTVNVPVISPNFLNPNTGEEERRFIDSVKAISLKAAYDLLGTIKVGN